MGRLVPEALLGGGELEDLGHAPQVLALLVVQRLLARVHVDDVAGVWR